MRYVILNFSDIDLKDRLTVDHYISDDLILAQQISKSKYPLTTLGKISQVKGGKRLPNQAKYSVSGIPYIRVVDIGTFEVDLSNAVYIAQELHDGIKRYQLKKDDIALVIVGATIGKCGIYNSSVSPCNFNENLAKITISNPEVNPYYILAYLQSCFGQAYINWLSSGSAQAKLSLERIKKIKIPIPPRNIQDEIAQIIQDAYTSHKFKIDASFQATKFNDRLLIKLGLDINLVKFQKRLMIQVSDLSDKWRVENNNISGLNFCLQSGIYKLVYIKDIAYFVNEKSKPNKKFRYIQIGDIDIETGTIDINKISTLLSQDAPNNAQRQVNKGDILISTRRPTRGAIVVVPEELNKEFCTLFFSIIRLKKNSNLLPEYVSAFLRTKLGYLQFQQAITETTYPVISASDIEFFLLPLPPLEVQRKIVSEITTEQSEAKHLRFEAETIVNKAKTQVKRMILGEEEVT